MRAEGILHQDLLPHSAYDHRIRLHHLTAKQWGHIAEHLSDEAAPVCGVSVRLSKDNGAVDGVAFATCTDVFYVKFAYAEQNLSFGKSNLARVLNGSLSVLVGFGMARLALHLHRHHGLHVEGVELSTLFTFANKKFQSAADFASRRIHPDVDRSRIHALWYGNRIEDACLRAWLSAVLATDSLKEVQSAIKVDTRNLPDSHLACLAQLLLNVELLEGERPTQTENEFDGVEVDEDGQLVIRNSRFNTRVRRSKQTSIVMETTHGRTVTGEAVRAEGKQTGVKVTGGNFRGGIERIRVIGREELTNSEVARDEFVLLLLQGVLSSMVDSPYIRMLWFTTEQAPPRVHRPATIPQLPSRFAKLNFSQKQVVAAMLADDQPLVVVHGPPGTGKTTTIAAALDYWDREDSPAWVIAQSNVGVQNIADKLFECGIDFKLLVSKEFYVEWHEHLYEELERHLLRSDELFSDPTDVARKLGSSSVVLCTISMLSNPAMDDCGIFRLIPVERLVVDEASQIDTFEFMHLFHKFHKNRAFPSDVIGSKAIHTLQKVCMFGDPKQLPPYGKETAPEMKTIYDFKQLKAAAYFLNTQYRMPVPLGEFVSENVYDNKLQSMHEDTDRSAVCFVDVRKGQEERVGSSWKNVEEARAVVNIVKNYYRTNDFCIITPYDAQRAEIARQLKTVGLPWEHVYNVDSFQGHEAEYVVVSAVRTAAPGFLRSRNRTNVMLTRCKRGMVLVSQRAFLIGPGRDTLIGQLAQCWASGAWRRDQGAGMWVDALALSDGRASLPGAPGRADLHQTSAPSSPPAAVGWTVVAVPQVAAPASVAGGGGTNAQLRPQSATWASVTKASPTSRAAGAGKTPSSRGLYVPHHLRSATEISARPLQPKYPHSPSGPPLILPPVVGGWRTRASTLSGGAAGVSQGMDTGAVRGEPQRQWTRQNTNAEGEMFPALSPNVPRKAISSWNASIVQRLRSETEERTARSQSPLPHAGSLEAAAHASPGRKEERTWTASRLRKVTAEGEPFPALASSPSRKPGGEAVKGRWRKGSEACRLSPCQSC